MIERGVFFRLIGAGFCLFGAEQAQESLYDIYIL